MTVGKHFRLKNTVWNGCPFVKSWKKCRRKLEWLIFEMLFVSERFEKNVEERGGKKRHERRKKKYREGLGMITGYLPWLQHFRGWQFTLASKNGKKRLSTKNVARLRPSRTPRIPRPLLPLYHTKSSPQSLLKSKMADAVWWTQKVYSQCNWVANL